MKTNFTTTLSLLMLGAITCNPLYAMDERDADVKRTSNVVRGPASAAAPQPSPAPSHGPAAAPQPSAAPDALAAIVVPQSSAAPAHGPAGPLNPALVLKSEHINLPEFDCKHIRVITASDKGKDGMAKHIAELPSPNSTGLHWTSQAFHVDHAHTLERDLGTPTRTYPQTVKPYEIKAVKVEIRPGFLGPYNPLAQMVAFECEMQVAGCSKVIKVFAERGFNSVKSAEVAPDGKGFIVKALHLK